MKRCRGKIQKPENSRGVITEENGEKVGLATIHIENNESVVCGIDDKKIYLQDSEIGDMRKLDREDFKTVWFDFRGKYIKSSELIIRQIIAIYR